MRFTTWSQPCVWMVEQIILQLLSLFSFPASHDPRTQMENSVAQEGKVTSIQQCLLCRLHLPYFIVIVKLKKKLDRFSLVRKKSYRKCDHNTHLSGYYA